MVVIVYPLCDVVRLPEDSNNTTSLRQHLFPIYELSRKRPGLLMALLKCAIKRRDVTE